MFSLVVIVTAWQGDLSRAFSEGGVGEKVNFKMCNISLKSNVFLHPMTTKCSLDHDKVCTNIIQLKKCKINNRFFWGIFFN